MNYLESNNLLSIYQFGFRSKRSTELAATLLVDNRKKEIDLGNYTGAIFLDLRKAFDTVSHGALLTKLPSYGIHGSELAWFENYLFNRRQVVTDMTKGRVMKWRVIPESYDFEELCSSHAQTTPTFLNDHAQYLNSPNVSLN